MLNGPGVAGSAASHTGDWDFNKGRREKKRIFAWGGDLRRPPWFKPLPLSFDFALRRSGQALRSKRLPDTNTPGDFHVSGIPEIRK
jgi:hypothetical protein